MDTPNSHAVGEKDSNHFRPVGGLFCIELASNDVAHRVGHLLPAKLKGKVQLSVTSHEASLYVNGRMFLVAGKFYVYTGNSNVVDLELDPGEIRKVRLIGDYAGYWWKNPLLLDQELTSPDGEHDETAVALTEMAADRQ